MGKDNVLEYPKLDNEVITVKNFMVIKEATMKCGDITVLVGEQARGKSLLAKLRYFFWNYQEGLINVYSIITDIDNKNATYIKEYNQDRINEFLKFFPNIENMKDEFSVKFQSSEISISIKRDKKDSKIKISCPKYLRDILKSTREAYDTMNMRLIYDYLGKDLKGNSEDVLKDSLEKKPGNLMDKRVELFFENIASYSTPSVLYVPAQRLFLATIQENPFKMLDSQNYNFDLTLKQFGVFWGIRKKIFSKEFKNPKRNKSWFKMAKNILDGDYIHRNDTDYIKNNWGEMVELKDASSGQQEVLPLLAAIYDFPHEKMKNQLLIIEEPEAHIYPTAQRALIKMIAEVARKKGCKVMMTTHSPYIPTCVNNEIQIAMNEQAPLDVKAYYVSDRTAQDIYLKKEDLIDTDQIDSVSEELMSEYYHALKEYDELNGKGNTRE